MAYDQVINNLSLNYQTASIVANTTLTAWNRNLYDVDASAGNITVTLPPLPSPTNTMERGSLFFRRLDGSLNTVTIVATLQGVTTNITLRNDNSQIHWFLGVADDGLYDDTFYIILTSNVDGTLIDTLSTNANYSINPFDRTISVDASAGDVTVTLPLAITVSSYTKWKKFTVRKTDTTYNRVIINTTFPDTFVDGSTSMNTRVPWHAIDFIGVPGSQDLYIVE